MASPQVENGHIDIANSIADKFCSHRLSGQEWQIVWVVLRKTWGWLEEPSKDNFRKKKTDRIALSQFAELTGIDRRKCHAILKKLISNNIIKKTVTQKGDKTIISYGFQKNYDLWKLSPKKATVTQKGDTVSPKKATKLSPKKAHTKDNKETLTKDNNTPLSPPKGGKKLPLKDQLKNYLIEKISGTSFVQYQIQLLAFIDYRMSLPAKDRLKTAKGIDGLLTCVGDLLRCGLDPVSCLEKTMEEEWLKPKPEYFNKAKGGKNVTRDHNSGFDQRTYESTPESEIPWLNNKKVS